MTSFPRDLQVSPTRLMFGGSIFATLELGRLAVLHRSGGSAQGGWYSQSSQCLKGPGNSESNIKERLEVAIRQKLKEADVKTVLLSVNAGFDAYVEDLILDDTGTFYRSFTNWLCKYFGFPKVFRGQIEILGKRWNVEIQDIQLPEDSGLNVVVL